MICFDRGEMRFNYRVAGIALHNDHVLLNRMEGGGHWFLPGGRVEMGETSLQGLRREMREELREDARVDRLLWIAEGFFGGINRKRYHELCFYYLMDFPVTSPIYAMEKPFTFMEDQARLVVQWVPLARLSKERLYPPFLVQGLQELPTQVMHIIDDAR